MTCATSVAAQGVRENKGVLLLFTHDPHQAAQVVVERALRSTLQDGSPVPLEIYSEYLDGVRTRVDDYEKEMVGLLRRKYAGKKLDLIITVNPPALRLLLRNRAELAPDTPIVFLMLDERNLAEFHLGPNVTGVWGEINYRPNLELALTLHPGVKQVVVISGVSEWDNYWRARVQEDFRAYEGKVALTYLIGLTISEQQKALAELSPQAIVFFVSSVQDRAGDSPGNLEVLRQICPVSSAPVYGTTDAHMGLGIVGGRLTSFEALGTGGAQMGLRVLAGEKPENITPRGVPSVAMFDWRELQRWGIDEQSLPPGSIIRFKEPTVWDIYKWHIIGGISLIILQALLIAYLLVSHARRRRAEKERERFAQLAAAEHTHLNEIVSNVPGIVWESLYDPDTNTYKLTFISDYAEKMLGYTKEEWLSPESDLGRSFMLGEEDRERVARNSEAVVKTGNEGAAQFRWRAKDGRILWAESTLNPIVDASGMIVGLRGVTVDVTEKQLAEEARRQSEERSRAILQAIPDLMFLQTRDGVFLDFHAQDPADLFVPPEEFLGKNMRDVLPPELVESFLPCFRRAEETGAPQVFEYALTMRGEERCYESRMVSSDGKILSVVRDITERKAAEETLRQSETRLRMAQQAARVGTWEWDIRTGASVWSEMIWELLGLEPDDEAVTVERFVGFIHPEDRDRALRKVNEVIAVGKEYYDEFRLLRPDGCVLWVSSKGRLVRSAGGAPERMLGVNMDITERKAAEETLRQSEARFRAMADSAPVMIWMTGTDKRCTYFNQQWLNFSGLNLEEGFSVGWADSVHPDDRARFLQTYHKAFDRREPFRMEYRLRRADGVFRWVYDTGTPRFSSGGEFLGYIGSCVDITGQKQAEDALQTMLDEVNRMKNQLHEENIYLREEIKLEHDFSEIVGHSDAIKYVLYKIEQVAPTNSTVLILGETGTGKELVARAIHNASSRKDRPMVKVNCAALSASLIESELFGHEKGAFTGATSRKIGRFELADGATIFLDEVGELPPELQSKLLRVLQEGEFERLGSSKTLRMDVRVIAATNRNLQAEVRAGRFREDLWYRLNVFPITVPPLRERREDVPLLVEHFVRRFAQKIGKEVTSISPVTMKTFSDYSWPGNVRELANVLERAVINTRGTALHMSAIFEAPHAEESRPHSRTLEEVEREYIVRILDETGWRIEGPDGAATILGLNPSTLRTRMIKLGIQKTKNIFASTKEEP